MSMRFAGLITPFPRVVTLFGYACLLVLGTVRADAQEASPGAVSAAAAATSPAASPLGDTIDDVAPKLVKLFGAGGLKGLYSYGTGFLISPDGYIVTVWSHVLDVDPTRVVLWNGRRCDGRVVGAEPKLDLAVLKIDAENLPYFDLQKSASAGPGTRVLAFSNMFQVATGDEPVSVLRGVVAAKTRLDARRGSYQVPYQGTVYMVDAITNNPGAGGGVLTTIDGRLLGMIGKELRSAETNTWVNYAMPIDELRSKIIEIQTGQFAVAGTAEDEDEPAPGSSMSVAEANYTPADFGMILLPDVVARTPAYIDRVLPGSSAEAAGLRPNDLVLFVGDELIQSVAQMQAVLARLESGGELRIVCRRDEELVSVSLPVMRKEAAP